MSLARLALKVLQYKSTSDPLTIQPMTYQLQMLSLSGKWEAMNAPAQPTEALAWQQLAAWERYCPSDRFRWVRNVPAQGLSFEIKRRG